MSKLLSGQTQFCKKDNLNSKKFKDIKTIKVKIWKQMKYKNDIEV
ncbi:hypothetical protein TOT_040000673 [Theileria orientalis strain Shintoku]|uniref:Uncharacterized protein n=1 Tax=Theileria orientalis strain Shintoku TaxID=869250 RepID=J7MEY5_THEOR|nr:hypothetical protein TOT_040000673 [Theileria orientalis strain Shintoku]BAM42304.1 hypothetical protein TOT_040000673 [Theileria orientalis strain Shintoku]|eukprot:XP_009692605.1 hypothetical protein TOT_040000673 [Theileria orientalis strain Shintoku]